MSNNEDLNVKGGCKGMDSTIPLRMLVLADFTPDKPVRETSVSVDENNFDDVMGMFCPQLRLNVPDKIEQNPKEIEIDLMFNKLNSFRPEEIVSQVSILSELMGIRKLLTAFGDQGLSCQEFQDCIKNMKTESMLLSRLHASIASPISISSVTPAPEPTVIVEPLDSLFEMVDIPRSTSPQRSGVSSALDNLIAWIVQLQKVEATVDKQAVDVFISEIDTLLSSQLNEILHHPQFQNLESAWRGLKFLVSNTDVQKNIRIELLNVPQDQLRDVLYTHVFKPEYNRIAPCPLCPLSVMIADYQFDRVSRDIEMLKDISKMAQSIQVPFITSAAPEFFGMKSFVRLPALPQLKEKFNGPEYIKWNSFRKDEKSLWIMLTLNRFLLRFPYCQASNPVKEFRFEEETNESRKYLYGNAVWAIGSILAYEFAESGWCLDICGQKSQKTKNVLTSLPTHEYQISHVEKVEKTVIPLEVLIPERKQAEFALMGISLLTCQTNSSSAYMHSAPVIHVSEKYNDPKAASESIIQATLPYQLFASRLSHYLRKIEGEMPLGLSIIDAEKVIKDKMLAFISLPDMAAPDESVVVQIIENEKNLGTYDVGLRVRPVFKILEGNVDIVLGWSMQI